MKKWTKQDDEILALTECLILWDRLAETGRGKVEAIDWLYKESKQ